jgi:endonuclease YncB( thermonuclease family)
MLYNTVMSAYLKYMVLAMLLLLPNTAWTETSARVLELVRVVSGDTIIVDIQSPDPLLGQNIMVKIDNIQAKQYRSSGKILEAIGNTSKEFIKNQFNASINIELRNMRKDPKFACGVRADVYLDEKSLADELLRAGLVAPKVKAKGRRRPVKTMRVMRTVKELSEVWIKESGRGVEILRLFEVDCKTRASRMSKIKTVVKGEVMREQEFTLKENPMRPSIHRQEMVESACGTADHTRQDWVKIGQTDSGALYYAPEHVIKTDDNTSRVWTMYESKEETELLYLELRCTEGTERILQRTNTDNQTEIFTKDTEEGKWQYPAPGTAGLNVMTLICNSQDH